MTNGMRSSEFWLALLVKVVLIVAGAFGVIDPNVAAGGVAATATGYAISRGQAKSNGGV